MKTIISFLSMLVGCSGLACAAEPVDTSPAAAATWLAATPSAQILDVRTKEEFATGHLSKAALIPWTDNDFRTRVVKEIDPKKPVLVYCRSGRRSKAAAAALAKLGFVEIRNLNGGILAWQKAGQAISKPE